MFENIFTKSETSELSKAYTHCGYTSLHFKLIDIRNSCNEEKARNLLNLLVTASSITLKIDNKTTYFVPPAATEERHTFNLSSFSNEDLAFFDILQRICEIPPLKARLLNILLEVHPLKSYAQELLKTYDEYIFTAHDYYHSGEPSIERYIIVALRYFRKDKDFIDSVFEKLVSAIEVNNIEHPRYSLALAKLLRQFNYKKNAVRISTALDLAIKDLLSKGSDKNSSSFFDADMVAQEALNWHIKSNNNELIAKARITLAHAKELFADVRSPIVSLEYYLDAIRVLKEIANEQKSKYNIPAKIEILEQKLENCRKNLSKTMQSISYEEVVENKTKSIVQELKNLTTRESLILFSNYFSFNIQDISKEVIEANDSPSIADFFNTDVYTKEGRKCATIPGLQIGDELGTNHKQVQEKVKMHYLQSTNIAGAHIQELTKEQLYSNEEISEFIHSLIYNNPHIEADKKPLFHLGLMYGFHSNFPIAMHLLAPQLESMVRSLLQNIGAYTKKADRQNNENEVALGSLTEHKEFDEIFGVNLSYEIKTIFCTPPSPNIRNSIAHGLVGYKEASSPIYAYAWWLILHVLHYLCSRENERAVRA